jgi:hypothetical protein
MAVPNSERLETPQGEEPDVELIDPELVVAMALAEAEVLKIQAGLVLSREPEREETPRDLSPLGSRF